MNEKSDFMEVTKMMPTKVIYEFVRDEIKHSWDVQDKRVTKSATEVLEELDKLEEEYIGAESDKKGIKYSIINSFKTMHSCSFFLHKHS